MPRKWTQAQRQEQARKIKNWQPWKQAAGAKTKEGRAISAKNAFRGGLRPKMRQLARDMKTFQGQLVDIDKAIDLRGGTKD